MLFPILTLLSALSLSIVAGWFSIVGVTAIYAGALYSALIMGIVLECAKLVTTSWLYRNWEYSNWKLKIPLIIFTILLMFETSIGVFGYLSKAHLQQSSSILDNRPKIENFDRQISQEKKNISDNEKILGQLNAIVESFISKEKTDKSIQVRKSQTSQRNQLKVEIENSNNKINQYNEEKLKLQSELDHLELEVGSIRYISELFFGNEKSNIELAVKLFTLLIVLTLDPLAIILLIAANHAILRIKLEKITNIPIDKEINTESVVNESKDEIRNENITNNSINEDILINDTFSVEEFRENTEQEEQINNKQVILSWIDRFKKGKNG